MTFTIENSGDAHLKLSGVPLVQITGTNASKFTVTSQPDAEILPGGSTEFKINLQPTCNAMCVATVTIVNDDEDESSYKFEVRGGIADNTSTMMLLLFDY